MARKVTTEQEKELIDLYQKGVTTKELCLKYGWSLVDRHGPLNVLKKYNIPIRMDNMTHATRYVIDENYFNLIDSKDKAYFLGLIYADGSVHYKKNEMKLPLQESDKHILDLFSKYIKSNKPLRFKKKKQEHWQNMYSFIIENKILCDNLKKLGVLPKKEDTLTFPDNIIVPEEYISHFIRGFFDGDGSVYIAKENNYPAFGFTGTSQMINSLNSFLHEKLGLREKPIYKRFKEKMNNTGYQVSWSGKSNCKFFYDWLYKDCDDLYICRKKEKFELILKCPV